MMLFVSHFVSTCFIIIISRWLHLHGLIMYNSSDTFLSLFPGSHSQLSNWNQFMHITNFIFSLCLSKQVTLYYQKATNIVILWVILLKAKSILYCILKTVKKLIIHPEKSLWNICSYSTRQNSITYE